MITKRPLCKQVIISMNDNCANNFIKDLSMYVININWTLKNIKLNIMVNYIHVDSKGIVIAINNIVSPLDLQAIEKYVKSAIYVKAKQVQSPRLPQFKSYLKIVSVLYISKTSNTHITSNNVERILKNNYIFNDIVLASKPRIIKVSSKSDMSIIWINIWNAQSGSKTKTLINRKFNVGRFIATIWDVNMNPGVPQCKNCWK